MKINIYATSDIHGYIYPYDYAKDKSLNNSLAHIYDCFKKDKVKNKLLVDNGDIIQGNFAELFIDEIPNPIVNIMNEMNYSIWNMGNHEFNFSFPKLKTIVKDFKNSVLMANSNSSFFCPYKIIEIEGVKISFIGINTVLINEFEKKESLNGLVITDPVIVLNKILMDLSKKTDLIVGMFHMGLEDENSVLNSGISSLLNNIEHPEFFDIIISGHSHKSIENLIYRDILITQSGAYANTVSKIELEFKNRKLISKKSTLIDLLNYVPAKEILDLYEPYHQKILEHTNKVIGYVQGITGIYNYDLEDNPLNHLLTQIMLYFSKADVVSFQIDNENVFLNNGPLKRKDLAKLYSYDGGEVTSYLITGKDLKKYILWSYEYFEYKNNKLIVNKERSEFKYKTLDVFGNIKYTIDLKKENSNKLIELKYMDGKDILDNDEIVIGMNEYRMNFLVSKSGPLKDRTFKKLHSTKYIDKQFHKRGTIRELAEIYFDSLPLKTFTFDNREYFKIKS